MQIKRKQSEIMASRTKSQEALGDRLTDMLTRLNNGETLDINTLPDDYNISLRTAQRDISRLSAILTTSGSRYYKLDTNQHGHLSQNEIQRFCVFASIQDLFPENHRRFFQEKLQQSITVKGFQYENIKHKQQEFDELTQAIENHQIVTFDYSKANSQHTKPYRLEPYHLVNKNGIWYLIGLEQGKEKTFCFNQIENLQKPSETFEPDSDFVEKIKTTDSISHGNQINEIVIQVDSQAAHYFQRRNLLPNQELIRKLDNGNLLLACKNVNEMEVIPIVQYWIPHLSIISPSELQEKMIGRLNEYLNKAVWKEKILYVYQATNFN